jgi:SAM-dependent methyltransferase
VTDRHYDIWKNESLQEGFRAKTSSSFFETERRFVAELIDRLGPVLDIGCASGRFVELLQSLGWQGPFTGIDIIDENIVAARRMYPQHVFRTDNAVDMALGERFDLVNATGVVQHEPRFEALVRNMLAHSNRYVLFDAKLGPVAEHLVDLQRSYCEIGGAKAYFICLSFPKFLEFLTSLEGIGRIRVFGYPTGFNKTTVVPPWLKQWVSAGFLIEKGKGPAEVDVDLPALIQSGAGAGSGQTP